MAILATCPSCGLASDEIRCPRCNSLKVVGCSGSCALCKDGCSTEERALEGSAKEPGLDDGGPRGEGDRRPRR